VPDLDEAHALFQQSAAISSCRACTPCRTCRGSSAARADVERILGIVLHAVAAGRLNAGFELRVVGAPIQMALVELLQEIELLALLVRRDGVLRIFSIRRSRAVFCVLM